MLKKLGLKLLVLIIMFNTAIPIFSATTIPTQAWSRDINAGGYLDGGSIGGFGAGTVTWRFDGAFYKQRLNIGAGNDSGSDFVADTVAKFYMYQKPASGAASTKKLDAGTLGSGQARYYSLFPKSWVDYYGSQFTVKSIVTQYSPIIPNDMTRTSYPAGIYEWDLSNPTAENVDVAIMLTWQNNDFSGANAQFATSGNYRGIVLRSGVANPTNKNQGEFCLGTEAAAGTTVSYMSAAAIGTIETDFTADGVLANTVGNNTIGAIAFKVTLAPGTNVTIPIVLSWDIPIAQPASGSKWYRKYTRHWTRTGQNSWAIAQDSLANRDSYESQIDAWQAGVLTNPNYPAWLKTMMFNELYIYFVGGTIWEAGAASGQQDNANEDMFSHLESYIYQFYGTSDVRFYGSWALFLNWPELDKQAVRQFSDSLSTTRPDRPAAIGTTAHDFGDLSNVFQAWNAYVYRDSTNWKDLNSKFVLMVYRDWLLTGGIDTNFLNYCWNSVKVAMAKVKSQDTDADGLPESTGIDQTYDDMDLTGTTSYCGSLFLAACQAAKQLALAAGDNTQATTYQSWYDLAQPNFETDLWNGTYYNIDTGSFATNRIMSDQLAGQWYSKALNLGGIVSDARAVTSFQKIYDNNYAQFGGGAHGVCNVFNAAGTIDTSSPQTQECWAGTSWGVVSGMVLQNMTAQASAIGQSLYNTVWNTAQWWFRTPEAWRVNRGSPRAFYYMRGSTIWAAKRSYDILMPVASPTNTPICSPTRTWTRTPYYSPTITPTITFTATVNPCITSFRRVNCGGPQVTTGGNIWLADQAYAPGGWGYLNRTAAETIVGNAIANTTDDALYQSGSYGSTLGYNFTVANGPWRVILKFAEIYYTAANARVFNVFLEGTQVLSGLDIYTAAGNAAFSARDYTFDTVVSDGILNITTNSSVDNAKFSAIEIIDLSTQCSPTVTSTMLPGTATRTPTYTRTRTYTPTPTNTPYYSPTNTPSSSNTRTNTPYFSPTYTPTQTITRTNTPFISATVTRTMTISPTFTNTPVFTPIRVNCAGPLYTSGSTGFVWAADKAYVAGSWGYVTAGATNDRSPHAVANTVDPTLYLTERWASGVSYMYYSFDVPDGTYEVTLKFTEQYYTAANQRQFNILLEGITMQSNFDIIGEAGAAWTAVDKVFTVTVSDGTLNVNLTQGLYDVPLINAIQVLRVYPTPTPTSTRTPVVTNTFTPSRTATGTYTRTGTPVQSATYTATRTMTATYSRTSTSTPVNTFTFTAINTQTFTRTVTATNTPLNTASVTSSLTPVNTFTRTATGTPANTGTLTRTATMTNTQVITMTYTPVNTWTFTRTATATSTYSLTLTLTMTITDTFTRTNTPTYSVTLTGTNTFTATYTRTATPTLTRTPTGTFTFTRTNTPTYTITQTNSVSPTITETSTGTPPTWTFTPTVTQSWTITPTFSLTLTLTSTLTFTATATDTPVDTETATPTCTSTSTRTITATPTYTITLTRTRTATLTVTRTNTPMNTPTDTPVNTASATASVIPTGTPTDTPVNTASATASVSPSNTNTRTPTNTPLSTVTQTGTIAVTLTATPVSTALPSATCTYTPVISPTPVKYEIRNPVVYPNPYNPASGDFSAYMYLTHMTKKLVIRVYTVSFRKVLEEKDSPGAYEGGHVMNVPSSKFGRLASGTYYYRIEGESTAGRKASSVTEKFVIIR